MQQDGIVYMASLWWMICNMLLFRVGKEVHTRKSEHSKKVAFCRIFATTTRQLDNISTF